ncbi:MAG: large subunit GTPase 1 [Bacillariaceae sp.]|jgi:large subunit GTPase 1
MPRSQGTSRKGKMKKHERAAGMGRALQKSQTKRHTPSASTGGMTMRKGVESVNVEERDLIGGAIHDRSSVLDVNNLDDFLIQAEMADREFVSEKEQVVVLDPTARAAGDAVMDHNDGIINENVGDNPSFAFQELSVPRRPAWDENTTADELDKLEKESFLGWRRAIAEKEEEVALRGLSSLGVTPFEKNIEIWRQLWRVMERCSCIVQIVDARNPLFYLSKDLKEYTTKELGKPMLLMINKSDYLSPVQRQAWHEYFSHPDHKWEHVFFSAHEGQQQIDDEAARLANEEAEEEEERRYREQAAVAVSDEIKYDDDDDDDDDDNEDRSDSNDGNNGNEYNKSVEEKESDKVVEQQVEEYSSSRESFTNVGVETPLSRVELLDWLQTFANANDCATDPKYDRVPFGMVGFPNVGKSSVINVLMGNAKNAHGVVRVAVAAQPGKTKHFQTLLLPDRNDMLLCDCPGLVFPSFVSNTADLIAAGVYPIAQMRDWRPVINLLCHRIPREVLNAQYSINIPMPTADAMYEHNQQREGTDNIRIPPPTADEFLTAYCVTRSMLAAGSGLPDYSRASRIIVMEYATGSLLFCHSPPNYDLRAFQKETLVLALQKTKKLREKFSDGINNKDDDVEDQGSVINEQEIEDDDMLLEILGGSSMAASDKALIEGCISGQSKRQKKWGKKGRKGRNRDPYGCHSTPDEELGGDNSGTVGVSVKGGKKFNRKNYTRPAGPGGYGVTRAFDEKPEKTV